MKRFAFDLESVLLLRKYREQEAEIALGKEVGDLNRIEKNIADVAEEKKRSAAERFSLGYSVSEMRVFDLYTQRLDWVKEKLLEDAARAELKVEAARKVYLEAEREREVLDKVKEGELQEHRKQGFTEEAEVLDDVSNEAFIRNLTEQNLA
ncbi:MAG: flagellar export protein FliJ [Treponema sp.]|jgi:flagellar FliJ protein|nr:flagellar export protein FliJ [Treponema sp.]